MEYIMKNVFGLRWNCRELKGDHEAVFPGHRGVAKGNAADRYRENSNEATFAVAIVEIYAHESLTFNDTVACEVISKWKAGLKEDMDVHSDVYVLSNGCRKSSDDNHNYYSEYAPGMFIHLFLCIYGMVFSCGCKAEIWPTHGLLVKAKGNVLGLEIIRDQSGNTLRVSQSMIHNEKLVQTLLEGHLILSLEDSLLGDCDVEKNKWYQELKFAGSLVKWLARLKEWMYGILGVMEYMMRNMFGLRWNCRELKEIVKLKFFRVYVTAWLKVGVEGQDTRREDKTWNCFEDSNGAAFAFATVEKMYAYESLTFNSTVACEVISKWKAGLKDDTDARSDVIANEKLVQTLLKGHSILSLEGSLSGECDVKKNDQSQAAHMTLIGAWKKEIWLKGLLEELGYELSLVAVIATGTLVKGGSRSEVPAQVKGAAYRY
ncbi:hypothetical protein Tco_1170561 [Tanacetum coccineum]